MSKTNKSDRFLKLVGKHQEKKKKEKFKGTLSEYLKVIESDTSVARFDPQLSTGKSFKIVSDMDDIKYI